ncbi:PH domain-containing protein [Verrucomicrobiota bacterium sgz303538]
MLHTPETYLLPHLDPGERLLWSGQPRGGIRLRAQDVFLIPFSLFWGGFAIFWEVMALTATSKAPGPVGIVFPLFGLPFVVMGLYLIFGRFLVDARIRAKTFYGVTNERIIIISGLFSQQIKSLQLRTLTDVSLTQRGEGSGSITFGPTHFMNGFFPAGSWPGTARYAPPSFDLIDGAKEVYDVIRSAQRGTPVAM